MLERRSGAGVEGMGVPSHYVLMGLMIDTGALMPYAVMLKDDFSFSNLKYSNS